MLRPFLSLLRLPSGEAVIHIVSNVAALTRSDRTVDPVTSAVTATWVNTDGTKVPAAIVNVNDLNQAVVLTGDVGSFQSVFGVPYPELVSFTAV